MSRIVTARKVGMMTAQGVNNIIMFAISPEEVHSKDYSRIDLQMKELKKAKYRAKEILNIYFTGYDNDTRELCEIPGVRSYLMHIYQSYPELLFYIPDLSRNWILYCLVDLKIKKRDMRTHRMTLEIKGTEKNKSILYGAIENAEKYELSIR